MSSSSFLRLGSANTYDNALRNLQSRQTSLSNLQENLTSGKKVVRASDDPTGAALAERALNRLERVKTDQRALETQRNAIATAESTLGDVTDALQNFRELVASAGNGSHTAADRKTIAIQLTGLRDQVFAMANRTDTNGLPLFSALGSALAPFVGPQTPAPDYTFQGLPGQPASSEFAIPFSLDGDSAFMFDASIDQTYNVKVDANMALIPANRAVGTDNVVVSNPGAVVSGDAYTITVTGMAAGATPGTGSATYTVQGIAPSTFPLTTFTSPDFVNTKLPVKIPVTNVPGLSLNMTGDIRAGDTFTMEPSASIFSVLDNAIAGIGGAATSNASSQAVGQALTNIDIGMGKVSAVRGQAGDLLNRADRISTNQDKRSIQLEDDRSRAEDLDMIKGIADFQNQQTGYQAALQSYAQVQQLSLFKYIG
ncbi:MAG: flagellar hook-associated protein 3 [Burkholderiales bacterium RIFCSPLOWO2_12_FULL_61_40]|nr:MAG: flagellar hook-associated protein 3 [Burkholderiales bacterium RIFCSPLOWO2_12_FULL_61_40]